MSEPTKTKMRHSGKCHCGSVGFAFSAPEQITVQQCNCSICAMTGFLHYIVTKDCFELLQGQDVLTEYQFNSKTANHLFCAKCGVKSFYIPRSNPNGYSLNMNCVEISTFEQITIEPFDGQNWEQNAASLAHLA